MAKSHLQLCKEMDWPPDMPLPDRPELMLFYDDDDDNERKRLPAPLSPDSPLEKLPVEIMGNVTKFLEYKDGINLGKISRYMYYRVKPAEMVPIHERFVLTKEKFAQRKYFPWEKAENIISDFPGCTEFPCFVCFRVRKSEHFSQEQIIMARENQSPYWRMQCKQCVHKMYVEGDQKLLTQYESHELCGDCQCLKHKQKRCQNCDEWAGTVKMRKEGPPFPLPPYAPGNNEAIVGSYDERRGRSFLRPDTFPLAKRPL